MRSSSTSRPAYYYTPAGVAVNKTNTAITTPADLDGMKVCVGVSTTYQDYLSKTLVLGSAAPPFKFQIDNPQITTFTTDTDALDALALGDGVRCDGAVSAIPIIQSYIDDGGPIKLIGDPIYFEPLSIALDKNAPVSETSLLDAVSKIVTDMHDDGTLSDLSQKWWKTDLTTSQRGFLIAVGARGEREAHGGSRGDPAPAVACAGAARARSTC